ncbi:hypothetical protein COY28_00745 [Candidatus Woesearchaeota archaeon CG_4_10_14_0_2_um_filter_57_5]|nr:MAG: hypothetical protein COY28_00745 [Candidatus Woesearchaeota archaeon CG_4_10_14_0_2_um_filter_57_5]
MRLHPPCHQYPAKGMTAGTTLISKIQFTYPTGDARMHIQLTRISEKGQVVIPSSLRKAMGIKRSDQFLVFGEEGTVILKKLDPEALKQSLDELARPLRRAAKDLGVTRAEVRKAVKDVRKGA